jgi:hypothetical protein
MGGQGCDPRGGKEFDDRTHVAARYMMIPHAAPVSEQPGARFRSIRDSAVRPVGC